MFLLFYYIILYVCLYAINNKIYVKHKKYLHAFYWFMSLWFMLQTHNVLKLKINELIKYTIFI